MAKRNPNPSLWRKIVININDKAKTIAFVEYHFLYKWNQNKPDLAAKKNKINQLLSLQTNQSDRLKIYIENIDDIEDLSGRLFEKTIKGV